MNLKKLSRRQMREEAEALIALSQAESRKIGERIREENLLRLGIGKPRKEPLHVFQALDEAAAKQERQKLLNFSRIHPSQRMLKAKQEYISIAEKIKMGQGQISEVEVMRAGSQARQQPAAGADEQDQQEMYERERSEPIHPPVYRSISPSFFDRLHNAIKAGYPKPDAAKERQSRLSNEEAQKLIQKAAIDLAAHEAVGGDVKDKDMQIGESFEIQMKMTSSFFLLDDFKFK